MAIQKKIEQEFNHDDQKMNEIMPPRFLDYFRELSSRPSDKFPNIPATKLSFMS